GGGGESDELSSFPSAPLVRETLALEDADMGRFVSGSRLRTERLAERLPQQLVAAPRQFIRPVAREGDDTPLAVEHDDLLAEARNQLERTDSDPAKRSNQFFLLIDASRHINAALDARGSRSVMQVYAPGCTRFHSSVTRSAGPRFRAS